jgi:hypothetical protein
MSHYVTQWFCKRLFTAVERWWVALFPWFELRVAEVQCYARVLVLGWKLKISTWRVLRKYV